MKFKEIVLVSGLLLCPNNSSENSIKTNIKENLTKTLSQETELKSDSPVFYKFDLSEELLNKLDSLDIYSWKKIIFNRQLEDLRNTPLFMKGTSMHIGEFLWYNQADSIIKKYNTDTLDINSIKEISDISFPLIYDELSDKIPHDLDTLLTQDKFSEHKNKLIWIDSLIVVTKQEDWKYTVSYYIDGRLFLASYVSIWVWKATPQWLFSVKRKIFDKRSIKYKNAPMPYALHLDGNIFIHQWYIDWEKRSHGCVRLPWLYQEILYYSTKIWTKVLIVF